LAKNRKAEAGAINIRIHPHDGEAHYASLLKDSFDLRFSSYTRGDQMLLMSALHRTRVINGVTQIKGVLARFTNIKQEQSWFNLDTNDEAEETDVRQIRIPSNLRPNYKPFSFIFFPAKHRFVFEKYADGTSISHGVVANYLKKLFSQDVIKDKYGAVNVDFVTDRKGLDAILNIYTLKHLEILIDRPNPDDHGREERAILERMNAQRVNRIEQRLSAISGQSLNPDRGTQILAEIALDNGRVQGDGKDRDGKRVEYSTIKFPRIESMKYDADEMSATEAFNTLAQKFA
jgi:hypothetical protein